MGEEVLRAPLRTGAHVNFHTRASHPAVRARSNTLGVPHQIYAVDSLALAEVAEAAVGGSRAPRRVADFCVPSGLIEPAHALLSYNRTDNLVVYTDRSLTEFRDLKC